MNKFAERLKELRMEQNLNFLQLSKMLQVSDTTIYRWENKLIEPTSENLIKISKFFKVTVDYLLGLSDDI